MNINDIQIEYNSKLFGHRKNLIQTTSSTRGKNVLKIQKIKKNKYIYINK